jgi:hypothetical protein
MVVTILNKMLGEYIWNQTHKIGLSSEDAEELNPNDIKKTVEDYENRNIISLISDRKVQDCRNLMTIAEFVRLHEEKEYAKAVEVR